MGTSSQDAFHDDFEAATGRLLTAAAKLEMVVALTTWGLAGLPQDIGRLVAPNDAARMLRLIRKLVALQVQDSEARGAALDWVTKVDKAYQKRNRIVHALWAPLGDEAATRVRYDIRPLSPEPKEDERQTPDDVRALAASMDHLARTGASVMGLLSRHTPGPWAVHSLSDRPDDDAHTE